jgi:multiple sugar transport system substrate-binding protein
MMKNLYQLQLLMPLLLCLNGCFLPKDTNQTQLQVWALAGQEAERRTIEQQVKDFNASDQRFNVELTIIPPGSYNAQIQAAALSQDLPDLIDLDGPLTANYAWQGILVPLDNLIPKAVLDDLLPSIRKQGTYQGDLYSVGTFDAALGLYGHRSQLNAAGVRIPKGNKDAWTVKEFDTALANLAKSDVDGQVLNLQLNGRDEWITFGYLPIIASAGGDLIRRSDYKSANGGLNSSEAVSAMTQVQTWIKKGYVDPNLDDAAFTSGRVALSWMGHWVYREYKEAAEKASGQDDLVVLPLPNFGKGSKTSQGSFAWGITTRCKDKKKAVRFLEFLLQPDQVLAMANADGAVPGTKSAIAQSELYGKNGPLHLFADQLKAEQFVTRPPTPAYPVITAAFQEAFTNIRNGGDVKKALDDAVKEIDINIQENQGYPDFQPVAQKPLLPNFEQVWRHEDYASHD